MATNSYFKQRAVAKIARRQDKESVSTASTIKQATDVDSTTSLIAKCEYTGNEVLARHLKHLANGRPVG